MLADTCSMQTNRNTYKSENRRAEQLAVAVGWFSVALGATELMAPRSLARVVGVRDANTSTVRAFGMLGIASGLAVLARNDRLKPVRSRSTRVHVEEAVTINRPLHEVYAFWKDFGNFPKFMRHIESVEILGNERSRWRAAGPAGITVEWEAVTTADREGELIAWRSVEGSQIENRGTIRFLPAPGARCTELRVRMEYTPPAGRLGHGVASLFGRDPESEIRNDLRRFKQLLETGEIPVSDGFGLWRPAQPAKTADEVLTLAGVQS
jgi:uncharacterized membrane protein